MPMLNTIPPNAWEPLECLLSQELVGQFMFMGVFLQGNARIHLYKHTDTREYLNVDTSGQLYVYRPQHGEEGRYDTVAVERERVLEILTPLLYRQRMRKRH